MVLLAHEWRTELATRFFVFIVQNVFTMTPETIVCSFSLTCLDLYTRERILRLLLVSIMLSCRLTAYGSSK